MPVVFPLQSNEVHVLSVFTVTLLAAQKGNMTAKIAAIYA